MQFKKKKILTEKKKCFSWRVFNLGNLICAV